MHVIYLPVKFDIRLILNLQGKVHQAKTHSLIFITASRDAEWKLKLWCVSLHINTCECYDIISDHLSHYNQHFGKMMNLCGENMTPPLPHTASRHLCVLVLDYFLN